MDAKQAIAKSVVTASSLVGSNKSVFSYVFIFFIPQAGQSGGHFILIMYLQYCLTPSKLLKLPAVVIHEPSSALLILHCTSPLELESEVWHITLQVVNQVESEADYGGLRQYEEADRDASIGELNEHKHVDAYSKQQCIIYTADNQVDIVEQGRKQHDQSTRLIKQCETVKD